MLLLPSGGYDMYDGNILHLDTQGVIWCHCFHSSRASWGGVPLSQAAKTCESPTRVSAESPKL